MHSVLLLVAAAGLGQPFLGKPAERFEQVPFQADLDAVLRQLLAGADEEAGLQKLLGQMRNHPQLDKDGLEWLNQLDLQNPLLRAQLRELAAKMPGGKAPTLEQLQALRTSLEAQMRNIERLGGGATTQNLPPTLIPPAPNGPNPAPPAEDRLAQWTRDLFEEVDQTRVGDFLRESPAWQRAVLQLERSIRLPEAKLDWLGRLPDSWRLPKALTNRLGNWSMGPLPQLSLPNWSFSAPRFNLGGFGAAPTLGAPTLGAPSIGSVSDGAFWILAVLLLGLLGVFFYRRLGHAGASAHARRDLGPWPVDPARISTRRDLVAAFDYLARLLLGDEVLTWNHRAITGRLSAAQPAAAQELGALYELARYAPGDDQPLPTDDQTAARRAVQTVARFALASPHAG